MGIELLWSKENYTHTNKEISFFIVTDKVLKREMHGRLWKVWIFKRVNLLNVKLNESKMVGKN